MRPVLAVSNHKGGPGKTTTAVNLVRHWQRDGRRPLAIDLDPQANMTRILGGCVNITNSIGDVLARRTTLDRATQMVDLGIYLVGSDLKLEDTGASLQGKSPNHMFLANALKNNAADAGVVVIDCAPAANILTINALIAATHVLVVLDPEPDAIEGMRTIVKLVTWLRDELGIGPKVIGAVVNKMQARVVPHRESLVTIKEQINVLGTVNYHRGVHADTLISIAYDDISSAIWTAMESDNA